jgi:hypothetical protein
MNNKANIQIHIVCDNKEIAREWVCHVPRLGDEIRLGGPDDERFYAVERIVWVYDEKDNPFDRVNIGVAESK